MRLHLTTTVGRFSGGHNARLQLMGEGCQEHLFSYAYRDQEDLWSECWDGPETMRLHFADGSPDRGQFDLLADEGGSSSLLSYAYRSQGVIAPFERYWQRLSESPDDDLRPRVIIDSGAFTAWTSGKTIDPRDYASWALDFDRRWRSRFASLEFMNLDVIGDQAATWRNLEILEGLGMSPLPIVTFGVDLSHLDRALEQYDYIALGGLVPYTRHRKKLQKWLDFCFARIMRYRKRTGVLWRIHLLGVTTEWVLNRYPCYSTDSSSWVACLRFGQAKSAGISRLPRYKDGDAEMSATIFALRSEIRKYKKMESSATKLWTSRGVAWDDA